MTTNDDRLTLRLPPHPIEGEGIGKHGPIICPGHPLTLVVRVSKMPRMATLTIAILKVLNIRVKPWLNLTPSTFDHFHLINDIVDFMQCTIAHVDVNIHGSNVYLVTKPFRIVTFNSQSLCKPRSHITCMCTCTYNWLTPPGHSTNKIYLQKIHIYQSTWATGPQQEIDCKYDAIKTSCRFCPFRDGSPPHIHYIDRKKLNSHL